ncbi:MAG: sensor histidine kinase [Blastocatellia bacterium]
MRNRLLAKPAGWFFFWTLVGLFFTTKSFFGASGIQSGGDLAEALRVSLPQWYVWGAFMPLLVLVDRRFAAARVPRWRLLFQLPASVVITLIYLAVFFLVESALYGRFGEAAFLADKARTAFSGAFQWNILIYWLLIGGWLAYDYYRESRDRELKASRLEKLLVEARLHALQAQLQPHFLFNALNTISAFVEIDPRGARRMIEHLGDLLRFSLAHSERQETTLAEELAALDHYLAIQRVRFEDQIRVEISVERETLDAVVPGLILQPLVENAIRHGVERQTFPGSVTISAWRENGSLRLRVDDSGPGLLPEWRMSEHAGVGLLNTKRRLEHLYPSAHGFALTNAPAGGTMVDITIPFREEFREPQWWTNDDEKIPGIDR